LPQTKKKPTQPSLIIILTFYNIEPKSQPIHLLQLGKPWVFPQTLDYNKWSSLKVQGTKGTKALFTNIAIGWKGLPGTNTPAYYKHSYNTSLKSSITLSLPIQLRQLGKPWLVPQRLDYNKWSSLKVQGTKAIVALYGCVFVFISHFHISLIF